MTDLEKLKQAKELLNSISNDWYFTVDDYHEKATGHLLAVNRKTKEVIDLEITCD